MKKNVIKTAFAAVCVVAAGMGGLKAYNVANQSQATILLAENIDALSAGDYGDDGDNGDDGTSSLYRWFHEQCKDSNGNPNGTWKAWTESNGTHTETHSHECQACSIPR